MQPVEKVAELKDDMDWRFVTVIAVVPSAGIFYSLFRTYSETKVCEPLPLSWLRMKRNLKFSGNLTSESVEFPPLFASGGYVKRILQDQVFRLQIQMRLQGQLLVNRCGISGEGCRGSTLLAVATIRESWFSTRLLCYSDRGNPPLACQGTTGYTNTIIPKLLVRGRVVLPRTRRLRPSTPWRAVVLGSSRDGVMQDWQG